MLKFKKGKQKASADSKNTQSDVSSSPQLRLTNFWTREDHQTEDRTPAVEDSKEVSNTGSAEDLKDNGFQVGFDAKSLTVFFTKGPRKGAANRAKNKSDDGFRTERGIPLKGKEELALESKNLQESGEYQSPSSSIFEPRGESSVVRVNNSKLMDRIMAKFLGKKIEGSPRMTPSPDPSTDRTASESNAQSQATQASSTSCECCISLKDSWDLLSNYFRHCRSVHKLTENALCYTCWLMTCLVCFVVGMRLEQKDVPFCVMGVIVWCCSVTLTFERGCFTKWLDQQAVQNSSNPTNNINGGGSSSFSWCLCCNADDPLNQHRSAYSRRHRQEDTEFDCTVVDVHNADPSEFPQIKMVEQTSSMSPSNSPVARTRVVAAVVHDAENQTERNVSYCPNGCPGACACSTLSRQQKSKVKDTSSERRKKSEATVPLCKRCGQRPPCLCIKIARKNDFKSVSPSLSDSEDVFICELHGPSSACGCSEFVRK